MEERLVQQGLESTIGRLHGVPMGLGVPHFHNPAEGHGVVHAGGDRRSGRQPGIHHVHVQAGVQPGLTGQGAGQSLPDDEDPHRSGRGGNDAQFPANFFEGGEGAVQVFTGVGCTELDADSGLVLGHDRVEESDHVDAFL